jgi:hypothetical protein
VPQDLLDYVTLRWLNEGDDFHLAGTPKLFSSRALRAQG